VDADVVHLERSFEVAAAAREHGNNPFGALLVDAAGDVVVEAENTVLTTRDVTAHAELNLVREAFGRFDPAELGTMTLYASTEPCAMCAGAIFWSGIGRVVFALSSATFSSMVPDPGGAWTLEIPCRDVFARGGRATDVRGPLVEDRARAVHDGFWQ